MPNSKQFSTAAINNHAELVEFLVGVAGEQVDRPDRTGATALLLAARHGSPAAMAALLRAGANLTALDKEDRSALFWAAKEDQTECVQLLLSQPAAAPLLAANDRWDATALHAASEAGSWPAALALLQAGAQIDNKNEVSRGQLQF